MAKKEKELLSQLTSEGTKGPFVTIMLTPMLRIKT